MAIDFLSTVKGSLLEGFLPKGWDMAKIDKCCQNAPETLTDRQDWWHKDFTPVPCDSLEQFDAQVSSGRFPDDR